MSFKRSTALTLATAAMVLGAGGPALAMPVHSDTADATTPVVFRAAAPPTGGGGVGTLTVVLLSTGALAAGAAAGFGGAKRSAARAPLHSR